MESMRLLVLVSVIATAVAVAPVFNASHYTVRLAYNEETSKSHRSANFTCSLSRPPFWRASDAVRWWKTQPFDNATVEISRGSRRMIPDKEKLRLNFIALVQYSSESIAERLIIQNIKAEDQGYYRCGVHAEDYNASNIWSSQIYIQPDITVTVNLSSTAAVTNGVSIYRRYSQGQITTCVAYVFGDPKDVTIQVWEEDQDITKYFVYTTQNQIFGTVAGFRAAASVVTLTSATYVPMSEENEVLRCEARRNNIAIANSSMVVKLSDTEVVLEIAQEPEVYEMGEAVRLLCSIEQFHISNTTEFRWMFVHTEKSGAQRTINLTSGEKNDIAETSFTENAMLLNIRKYSGTLSRIAVTLRDNGSTIATKSYDLVLKREKVETRSAAVAWKTYESMLIFVGVTGFFIKQLI